MGTVNDILTLAHDQLGNGGARYWNWYTDNVNPRQGYYLDGNRTPYCAEYISWLLAQTDTKCKLFPSSTAFDGDNLHPSERISKYELKVGDVISYDWDSDFVGDHVGLVVAVHDYGVTANEGNVSGRVAERTRYWSDILFGVRPEYEEGEEVTENDKKDIAKYVWQYAIDYINGDGDTPHTASAEKRLGFIDYYVHKLMDKLDEILACVSKKDDVQ